MEDGSALQELLTELELIPLLGQRPIVQLQLITFIVVLVVAGFLSTAAWKFFLRGWLTMIKRRTRDRRRHWMGYVQLAVHFLLYPALGLLLMDLVIIFFRESGWLATVLIELSTFFWLLAGYRLVLILLYAFVPKRKARYYHYWLALPVFIIGLLYWFRLGSVPLQLLSQIELFTLFEDPVTLGEFFWAIMSLYLLFTITRAIQDLLQGVIVRRSRTEPEGVRAILSIGRYLVLVLGLLMILAGIGFDMTALAVIGGGLSVGIGFGLQSIISNFISGIVLLFERSLRPGDIVEVEGIMGKVQKLDVRATTVRRFDNISMIIPNETLFTSTVTNYTQNDQVTRVMIDIGVSYNSDPTEVMDILRRVCRAHPLVMDDPEPLIFFKEYGDSSLKFGLGVWLARIDYLLLVPSELRTKIFAEFKRCGIEIPFPQRDLHIRSGLPSPNIETASDD